MIAWLGRYLAHCGIPMLHVDLHGTGDSSGTFEQATLSIWQQDIQTALGWLDEKYPASSVTLVALRLGALLTLELPRKNPKINQIILWQPVLNGALHMQQFLRLLIAGSLNEQADKRLTTRHFSARLEQGEALEIAGYMLSSQLYQEISKLKYDVSLSTKQKIHWFEMVTEEDRPLLPASTNVIKQLQEKGVSVNCTTVMGPQFWATQEIADSFELIRQTREAISRDS